MSELDILIPQGSLELSRGSNEGLRGLALFENCNGYNNTHKVCKINWVILSPNSDL